MKLPALVTSVASLVDHFPGFGGSDRPMQLFPDGVPRPTFLSPGNPPQPISAPGTAPRAIIAPVMSNVAPRPRKWQGVSLTAFQQLQALANFDLCRIAIEDVKGQILGMDWSIKVRQEFKEQEGKLKSRIDAARAFVDKPDPLADLDFKAWLGPVIEEILVTDALTLFPHFTIGGEFIGLEQIDGTTIVPLVDDRGRPPIGFDRDGDPVPAFQQVSRQTGWPECEFALGELMYLPRNRRTNAPYGRSNVENVLMTINLAIRATTHDLSYYTDGNLPDAIWSVVQGTSPGTIKDAQQFVDDLLGGKSARRAGSMIVMPDGKLIPVFTREWKPETYEWLARVICYGFQVSPLPLVRMMNRGTAQTAEVAGIEGGVRPIAEFIAATLNRVINQILGLEEVEFCWSEDEAEDPQVVYERNVAYSGAGGLSINRLKTLIGEDPIPDGNLHLIQTAAGPVFLEDLIERHKNPPPDPVTPIGGKPPDSGNGHDSQPQADAAAAKLAKIREELGLWRTVALKRAKEGKPPKSFLTKHVPPAMRARIERELGA